jgi:hypothetical protein
MQSDGQAGTALGTTCIDHAPSILGAHAGAETMGPLALQVAWLIRSFHGTLRLNMYFSKKIHAEPGVKGRKDYCQRG